MTPWSPSTNCTARVQCTKPLHGWQPVCTQRLWDAQVKDPILALCPTCWMEEEAPDHLSLWDQCQGVWHRLFNLYSKWHTVNPTIQLAAAIFKISCILWTVSVAKSNLLIFLDFDQSTNVAAGWIEFKLLRSGKQEPRKHPICNLPSVTSSDSSLPSDYSELSHATTATPHTISYTQETYLRSLSKTAHQTPWIDQLDCSLCCSIHLLLVPVWSHLFDIIIHNPLPSSPSETSKMLHSIHD